MMLFPIANVAFDEISIRIFEKHQKFQQRVQSITMKSKKF